MLWRRDPKSAARAAGSATAEVGGQDKWREDTDAHHCSPPRTIDLAARWPSTTFSGVSHAKRRPDPRCGRRSRYLLSR